MTRFPPEVPGRIRLTQAALAGYRGPAQLPEYDRRTVRPGILHLGPGAFHRSHQAVHVDDCLRREPGWGILGASLRTGRVSEALNPQDCLYTLGVRSAEGLRPRIIGSVIGLLTGDAGPEAILSAIAAPETRIISLTVTEKGYCRLPTSGALDTDDPLIAAELSGAPPTSVPAVLVEGLRRRRDDGAGPVTVMSCDNLQENGAALRRVVTEFGARVRPHLVNWIGNEANVSFPNSMVDRITPKTGEADIAEICALTGFDDAWPVITEPFSDWVLEDRFAAGRPRLEDTGVRLVADVRVHETMKLRILNGTHSMLAWLGPMLGHDTVADAIADPRLSRFLDRVVVEEIIPTVPLPPEELKDYWRRLRRRFANPALRHALGQIAMDSSQKLPPRLLAPLREHRRNGRRHAGLALGVAAWIARAAMTGGADPDPERKRIAELAGCELPDIRAFVAAVLALEPVFGPDLGAAPDFRQSIESSVADLVDRGAAAVLDEISAKDSRS
ncbi:MAG: mannitol dehydrogenase family protein [Paracoccaceae bacterium]|nr:mannitol dehydrogenase family protein [Paracoccaceae bacterium]